MSAKTWTNVVCGGGPPTTNQEREAAGMVPHAWADLMATQQSGAASACLSTQRQAAVRLKNPLNSCYAIGLLNLLYSSPAFIQFLSSAEKELKFGAGDVFRELQRLAKLGADEVAIHYIMSDTIL